MTDTHMKTDIHIKMGGYLANDGHPHNDRNHNDGNSHSDSAFLFDHKLRAHDRETRTKSQKDAGVRATQ